MPATRLAFDGSGHPVSPIYDDVFKSRAGAMGEASQVFVDGCRLTEAWAPRKRFVVLELGFGLGVNFLATLAAWRAARQRPARLHFVSVEKHPLSAKELARAHEALALAGEDAARLVEAWPLALPGLHRIAFADGAVELTLAVGDARQLIPSLALAADAFYLDGFAPARNPEMWSPELLRGLARLARPGATLATYSAATTVRDALAGAGFQPEVLPGYGGKRERLSARYAPRWKTFHAPAEDPAWSERHAIVVGAGLAGSACCAALTERGWRVTLIERGAAPAAEGSSQPVVADHLHLSPDDNVLARLTRAGLLAGDVETEPPQGKLVIAEDDAHLERQRAMVAALGFPAAFAQVLDAPAASQAAGIALSRGGLWLPGCRVSRPRALCERWLAGAGDRLEVLWRSELSSIARQADGRWLALDAAHRPLAAAPVVVLANAGDALRLAGMSGTALRRVRGQTTLLEAGVLPGLRAALGGDAYACPMADGSTLVGATFDDGADLSPDPHADLSNLRRLARVLGLDAAGLLARSRPGATGFRYAAHDRLPLIGPLPDEAQARAHAPALARNDRLAIPHACGLYGAFAFGSRGRLWARLGAAVLAAQIDGGPAPLEADLLRVVDPARFLRRQLRRRRLR